MARRRMKKVKASWSWIFCSQNLLPTLISFKKKKMPSRRRMKKLKLKLKVAKEEEFYLPEIIIHHIMSFLNPKESTQVSILSKAWLNAWRTNPKLVFDENYFHRSRQPWAEGKQKFRNYVKSTMARYKEEHINIQEFHYVTLPYHGDDSDSFLDQELQIAFTSGVKLIRLSVEGNRDTVLPGIILEAKSIRDLCIIRCKFQENLVFNMNIRSLHLKEVDINDEMFSSFMSGCPLIDDLVIQNCEHLNIFKVISLPNLRKLHVCFFSKILSPVIEIDAPCLESLILEHPETMCFPELLYSSSKTSLRDLQLTRVYIEDTFFDDYFPNIEVVKLCSSGGFKRINLSSNSLKQVCLFTPPNQFLEEIKIDAPNLTNLEYGGITFRRLQLLQTLDCGFSSQCVSHISMKCYWHSTDHASWFVKLNEFLSKLSPSKVSLDLSCWMWVTEDMCVGDITTCVAAAKSVQVEELKVDIESPEHRYSISSFLNGLFWACHPKVLVLHQSRNNSSKYSRFQTFTRFVYYELIRESPCSKFWQLPLEKVGLEMYDDAGKQYCILEPSNLNTFPRASKEATKGTWDFDKASKVMFKLEWNLS